MQCKNPKQKNMYPDLLLSKSLTLKNLVKGEESEEYGACQFEISCAESSCVNHKRVLFRTGKITPTKIGLFVTLWKRIGNGPILPYDTEDPFDLFIVSVRTPEHFGQFVFPKTILYEKGILSKEGIGGKRAMRVYPPWDITDNPQAKKTQKWQIVHFFTDPEAISARIS